MAVFRRPFKGVASQFLEAAHVVSVARTGSNFDHVFSGVMNTGSLPAANQFRLTVGTDQYIGTSRSWLNSTTLRVVREALPSGTGAANTSTWTGVEGGLVDGNALPVAAWANLPVT